jgi:hypothetical protein
MTVYQNDPLTDSEFKHFDPQSYIRVVGDKTYLIRPRLNPNDNWSVRNWLALEVSRSRYDPDNLKTVSELIRQNLTEKYLTEPLQRDNPLRGFCYIATQSIYYLMDTDRLESWSGVDASSVTHWWLADRDTGEIIDLTADQYSVLDFDPPYDVGRKRTWYGFRPFIQKRTMDLIHQIQPTSSFRVVNELSEL